MSQSFTTFKEAFTQFGQLLEKSTDWDQLRARMLTATEHPLYEAELMAFLVKLEDAIEVAMDPLLAPFQSLYEGEEK